MSFCLKVLKSSKVLPLAERDSAFQRNEGVLVVYAPRVKKKSSAIHDMKTERVPKPDRLDLAP